MGPVDLTSLAATIDAVNQAFFNGVKLSKTDGERAAAWIASRQGKPGSYCGMFAPTEKDFAEGIRFFTGERIATRAGASHILGEEACRALILLDPKGEKTSDTLGRAAEGMIPRLEGEKRREVNAGRAFLGQYCCGKCSVSLWRHLAVGGFERIGPDAWLRAGVKALSGLRDGKGRWRRFPFHYTLLALSEMSIPEALRPMRYAAPLLERSLKKSKQDDRYAERRRILAERILAKC